MSLVANIFRIISSIHADPVVIPMAGNLFAGFMSAEEVKMAILIPTVSFMAREVYQLWKDSKNKTSEKIEHLDKKTDGIENKLDHLIELLDRQDREYDRRLRKVEDRL